jgi:hypothetical protein
VASTPLARRHRRRIASLTFIAAALAAAPAAASTGATWSQPTAGPPVKD